MYVIDDTQSVFFEEATKALAGRGIECVPFSRFGASASNKNMGVYLAEATKEFDCKKDSFTDDVSRFSDCFNSLFLCKKC